MSKENYYKEIVDKEIEPVFHTHPYYNARTKEVFIKLFAEDMDISINDIKSLNNCEGLFSINIDNKIVYFYIEYIDGGGNNKHDNPNPRVKVSIPFKNKVFQNIILDDIVFIVNLYIPYKRVSENLELDNDNLVYLFVLPNQVFEATGYKNNLSNKLNNSGLNTNPSSRWVSLFDIKNCINDGDILKNNKKNVSIIPKTKIKNFINAKVKHEYQTWKLEKLMISLEQDNNDERKAGYEVKARKEFKDKLVNDFNPPRCQNLHHNIFHETALRGSHIMAVNQIKKQSNLTIEDKILYISDINNGLLLCANCDALFDKYKFTIIENGELLIKNNIKQVEEILNCKNGDIIISIDDFSKKEKYLKFHQKMFKSNN